MKNIGCEGCVRCGFCTIQEEQQKLAKDLRPFALAPQYKDHFKIFIDCTERVEGVVNREATVTA